MAGRIYVSPIIGTGTDEDPQRALICDLAGVIRCRSAIATIDSGTQRGKPSLGWALVYVDATDWTAIEGSNQVFLVRLDESFDSAMSSQVKTRIRQSGALTQAELDTVSTYREALLMLLQKHYPNATLHDQFPELFGPGDVVL